MKTYGSGKLGSLWYELLYSHVRRRWGCRRKPGYGRVFKRATSRFIRRDAARDIKERRA